MKNARTELGLRIALSLAAVVSLAVHAGCGSRSPGPVWGESTRAAFAQAEGAQRPVLVYFFNTWDEWCKKMDEETFRDPEVLRALEPFLLVRVNPEETPELALRNNVHLLPSTLVFDPTGELVHRITGFRTPRQMTRELAAALEEAGLRTGGEGGKETP